MKDSNEKTTVTTVARINNVLVVVVENEFKEVPIRPMCDAIGIDFSSQLQRIKSDPILSSTVVTVTTVGADGKQREMASLPLKYTFGWLFTIDSRLVKEEAKETVLKYQMECYDALYNHFVKQEQYLRQRQTAIDAMIENYDEAREKFKNAERYMRDAKKHLDEARSVTFEQWMADQSQLTLFSTQEQEG